jgi:hypothetical protein
MSVMVFAEGKILARAQDGVGTVVFNQPDKRNAMSIAMWPCGANCFHDAAGAWLELIQQGRVKASPAFQAWASLPSQDGLELPARRARREPAG